MRAIETRYKGYRFRSRLEARWAVFFDALGLHWEYEPEGFELPCGTRYLPDFRLRTPGGAAIWYEIKPANCKGDAKLDAFNKALDAVYDPEAARPLQDRAFLLAGDPIEVAARGPQVCIRCAAIMTSLNWPTASWPSYGFVIHDDLGCFACDMETPFGGYNPQETGALGLPYSPHKGLMISSEEVRAAAMDRMNHAAATARSARFEHGECPA